MDRRSFAIRATSLAAATLIAAPTQMAAEADTSDSAGFGAKPKDLSDADWQEVHAKYANLLRVYGDRLSEQDRHRCRTTLISHQHMLSSIRKFQVGNGDTSACTLRL